MASCTWSMRWNGAPASMILAFRSKKVLLAGTLAETRRHQFEFRQTDQNLPGFCSLMPTDDLEIFELFHHAHRAGMANRKLRLQRGRRRVVGSDNELCRFVTERIGIAPRRLVIADWDDFDVEQVVGPRLTRPELDKPGHLG